MLVSDDNGGTCFFSVEEDEETPESVRKKLGSPSFVVAKMGVASPPASKVVADNFLKGVNDLDLCRCCPPSLGWPRTQDSRPPVVIRLESELCTSFGAHTLVVFEFAEADDGILDGKNSHCSS